MPDDFIKSLWLQRLPSDMRQIISATEGDLTQMSKVADKIFEVSDSSSASEITTKSLNVNIQTQIDDINKRFKNLENNFNRSRSSSRNRGQFRRSRSRSKSRQRVFDKYWYHYKYGDQAKKCVQPCNFKKSEN